MVKPDTNDAELTKIIIVSTFNFVGTVFGFVANVFKFVGTIFGFVANVFK